MPEVIDALIVTLGLDASKYKEGREEVERSTKSTTEKITRDAATIEAKGAQGAEFFKAMQRAALDFGAALVSVDIVAFSLKTMKGVTEINALSHALGISIEQFDAWGKAAQEFAGANPGAAATSIANLVMQIEARQKTGEMGPATVWLQALGVDFRKPWQEQLFDIAGKFQGMDRTDPAGTTLFGQRMGLDPGFVNLLRQGPDAIRAHLAAIAEQGRVTKDQAEQMEKLQTALIGVTTSFETLGRVLLTLTSGALIDMLDSLRDVAEWIGGGISFSDMNKRFSDRRAANAAAGVWGAGALNSIFGFDVSRLGSIIAGGAPDIADQSMSAQQQAFLQRLSAPESRGDYFVRNGGARVANLSAFPEGIGAGGTSSAFGRYQFTRETWGEAAAALSLRDVSAVSQDRAAWWLANREYSQKTGRDLLRDLQSGLHGADIATALQGRWPTITGSTGAGLPINQDPGRAATFAPPTQWYDTVIQGALGRVRGAGTSGSLHSEVTIGAINVQTAATDANGIAGSIGEAVRRNLLVTQANRGLA